MIYTILQSFCSFYSWKGAEYGPKSGLGKSLIMSDREFTESYKYVLKSINKTFTTKKLFVAFPWVVSSTGPGGFMICVFIIWRELPKAHY